MWDTYILRNLWNFENLVKYFIVAWPGSGTRNKLQNTGQRNFRKYFKFHNFSEIFYCGMTRHRNTNLSVFMQCQYTRNILRKTNMGQSPFKKHSKFQNFDEIFYCGMTKLSNKNLDICIQCLHPRTILRKKNVGQDLFKKRSTFLKFIKVF